LLLNQFGVDVFAYSKAIGDVKLDKSLQLRARSQPSLRNCGSVSRQGRPLGKWRSNNDCRKEGDSLGGVVEIVSANVPVGIGEPLFDSLDADIAKALFALPALKA